MRSTTAHLSTPTVTKQPGKRRVPHIKQKCMLHCGQGPALPKMNVSVWERAHIFFLPMNQERVQPSSVRGQTQSPLRQASSLQKYISSFSHSPCPTPVGGTYFDSKVGHKVSSSSPRSHFSCPHSHTVQRSWFCHYF